MRRRPISVPLVLLTAIALAMASGCRQGSDPDGACAGKCDGEGRAPGSVGGDDATVWTDVGPLWVADWTLLVYAANDDQSRALVDAFDEDMEELRRGLGGSARFRILVQRDYAAHQLDGDGQPRQSERYGLYREQRFHPETLQLEDLASGATGTQLLGETDSSDPQGLADFLAYGVRRFPAKRYWVIVTGHGDGWNGVAFDASSGNQQRMRLAGLRDALAAAQQAAAQVKAQIRLARDSKLDIGCDPAQGCVLAGPGGVAGSRFTLDSIGALSGMTELIDVVQFDACHMGSIETAFELSPFVQYMVGSQEVVPNAGHPYSALRVIAQDRSGSWGSTVVEQVVTDYVRAYVDGVSTQNRQYVGTTVSSVGLDLTRLAALQGALVRFRDRVRQHRPQGFACEEVHQLAEAARYRANLLGHVIERPGGNATCGGAERLQLLNGKVMIRSTTAESSDELAALQCGGPLLAGPQSYYRFAARADRSYRITVNTDFDGGELYLFTGGCSAQAIQADCQSNGVSGATSGPLVRRQPRELVFAPQQDGEVYLAVDSSGQSGKFILGIQEQEGRATSATNAAVDLVALFETIAGFHRSRAHLSCDWVLQDPYPAVAVALSEDVRDAALDVLRTIGRPYIHNPLELRTDRVCGVNAMFGGQYRRLTGFPGHSPFLVEAHKIDRSTKKRASSVSILFGDVYPLTALQGAPSDLGDYLATTFATQTGWQDVFQACIDQVAACRNWLGQGSNPCQALPF